MKTRSNMHAWCRKFFSRTQGLDVSRRFLKVHEWLGLGFLELRHEFHSHVGHADDTAERRRCCAGDDGFFKLQCCDAAGAAVIGTATCVPSPPRLSLSVCHTDVDNRGLRGITDELRLCRWVLQSNGETVCKRQELFTRGCHIQTVEVAG